MLVPDVLARGNGGGGAAVKMRTSWLGGNCFAEKYIGEEDMGPTSQCIASSKMKLGDGIRAELTVVEYLLRLAP